jgi:hypothetical protein
LDQLGFAHRACHVSVESPFLRPPRFLVLQFLKVFVDIVLWRRGPQDLPASTLLLGLAGAAYVLVSVVQLAWIDEPAAAWIVFVVVDPLLLTGGTWLVLRLFNRRARFLQTATAMLGTGALLGVALFLPVQWLMSALQVPPGSTVAGVAALGLVVAFALVSGRILQLATESNLFTGVALSLTYFLLIDLLLTLVVRGGGG